MSLLPSYDPKSFDSVDLRKYHIRTIKDVIRFQEFVTSRMEESAFVLKKFSTQLATFKSISTQLQKKQEIQQQSYGAPSQPTQEAPAEIQKVDNTVEEAHNALLDDIRQAVAEENLKEELDDGKSKQAIIGHFRVVMSKRGPMFYRDDRRGVISEKDVPEDIKQQLLDTLE